jgi:ABC-type branched-subunit amino acid transport system ATPase component
VTTKLLEAIGISAGYKGHPVVRDLDLEVCPGEVVGLLGANGAGKSTTLRTLAGDLPMIDGELRISGASTRWPLHKRALNGLAFVPEKRSVFMRLTVAENLRLGRGNRDIAFDLFPELKRLTSRLGGELSGGEQQMLSLARALSRSPKLLMADELSLGLAPLLVTSLLDAVRVSAVREGVGVLLVEQHVHQMLRVTDRIYVMRRGRVVLSGKTADVATSLEDVEASYLARDEEE